MTEVAARLKDELLRLTAADRVELAQILCDSIDAPDDDMEADAVSWTAELNRRSARAAAGDSAEQPFREAIEELRKESL